MEYVDADGSLFEDVGGALQRLLDDVGEKFLTALAGAEIIGTQDAVQFFADEFVRNQVARRAATRHFGRHGSSSIAIFVNFNLCCNRGLGDVVDRGSVDAGRERAREKGN